jgi:hypothetical protein
MRTWPLHVMKLAISGKAPVRSRSSAYLATQFGGVLLSKRAKG